MALELNSSSETSGTHELCVIYSDSSISELTQFLNSYDKDEKCAVALSRIDYFRLKNKESPGPSEYVETNRTIVLVKKSVWEALKSEGYTERTEYDFRICKYDIRSGNVPPEGCTYSLFVVVPPEIPHLSADSQIRQKLNILVNCGLIPKGGYTINFPTYTRENEGKYRGYAIVCFTGDVNHHDCSRIKIILDMTKWTLSDGSQCFCHIAWCRQSTLSNLNPKRRKKGNPI